MDNQFTPGPWTVMDGWDKDGNGTYFPSVVLSGNHKYTQGKITINVSHNQEAESIMANAYLIAAAPDLFKVIEELSTNLLFSHAFGGSDIFFAVKAAYNKALNK